ncbi:MAG: protoporphyrinogen oxidase [Verrucomicrobiales bacterium]|jgi:protoporphyrinogen oxidase
MPKPTPQSWAVIGGGFLGITLALRLRQAGHDVTLIESAPELGGLAAPWQIGDITWDKHYHVTLMSDLRARALLDECGLEKDMRWVETKTGFYTGGQLYSMSNTVEFLKFPPLRLVDKIRLGATIFYASKIKDPAKLETINVCDWLKKLSGKNTFEKIWLPLLRAKLGPNYNRVSASFIWAIIARMYAAKKGGLKKEMFGYLPGGYDRFIKQLVRVLKSEGIHIQTNSPVDSIVADPETGQQIVNGHQRFDQIAVTLPAKPALRICADQLAARERTQHEAIEYQGIICASAILRKPIADYYVTNITDPAPFTAVIEMTALVDPAHLKGNHLVYLPKYVPRDDEDNFNKSDAEIEEEFTAALLKMYPSLEAEDITAFKVSRAKDVLALATENYTANLPPVTTQAGNLHIINSSHIVNGTLNINETIQLAEQAAESLALTPNSTRARMSQPVTAV